MCDPLPLSPTAELHLTDCPFLKRDIAILAVCDQNGIVRVKDLLRERYVLINIFSAEQVAVLYGLLADLKYSLETLGLKKLNA